MSEATEARPEPRPEPQPARRRTRLRKFLWSSAGLGLVLAVGIAILVLWASSPSFESWVRTRLAARIAEATGGRVEIREFHWRPLHLEAEAVGLTIHGREASGEEPYAQVERLRARLSVLDIWSASVLLRELEVARPRFHLIVYRDGTTNQPEPRPRVQTGRTSPLDTIFDLQAGQISVTQGALHYEDRAADFDFQNRLTLLDFSARDVSVQMKYAGASRGNPESYRIEAGARDLRVLRGEPPHGTGPADGSVQATIDLTRKALFVRSLRLTSRSGQSKEPAKEHSLEIVGSVEDFTHPRWQGRVTGDLDMRLLEAETGYADTPEGIARLNLNGAGHGGQFRIDGAVHVEGAAYVANGVRAKGVGLDAHLHADPQQLLITAVSARLQQGGRVEGSVALAPWLAPVPGTPTMGRAGQQSMRATPGSVPPVAFRAPPVDIPMNGKVTANLKNVSLDELLDIVSEPPLQRLGFNTLLNGTATATWSKGETSTLVVGATLGMMQGAQVVPGEVAASGAIDATYMQRNGAVDLRRLELQTAASTLEARGSMGAYPVTSATALAVDFQSHDLRDFDTFLRNLGLKRNGRAGIAALPAALEGSAQFHGTWSGSLVDPRLAGSAQAAQLAFETAQAGEAGGEAKWVHWDSIDAKGSYSAGRIEITHGELRRGSTDIGLEGDLAAAAELPAAGHRAHAPEFDDNAMLHLRLKASHVPVDQLQPLVAVKLPVTGTIETQLALEGPIRALSGAGMAELDGGSVYGQPVKRMRAQGSVAGSLVTLSTLTASTAGGTMEAKGEFNFETKEFKVDSHGSGIDITKLDALRGRAAESEGRLGFTLNGSGTLDDPRLNASGSIEGLAVNGQPFGTVALSGRTADRLLTYDASTRFDEAAVTLHGETALKGDNETKAEIGFTQFNVGAVLAAANLESLSGTSSLAGKVTIEGPLAKPDELRGEIRLPELAVAISGVHLKSEGGLHATMAGGKVTLDPLHVTGEQTDMHLQGTLGLHGQRQVDFAASGTINLTLGQMLDPDLTASGTTTFQVEGHGPLRDPGLRGRIDFQNGSLALEDVPNGLSQLHGTLEFNQDRLEVKSLTAMSGGGQLSVGGYLAYQRGLYADLKVTGKGIRIRYPTGVSSLADGTFHLQGVRNSLLLSGDVLITRFSVSPDLDIAALAAQANAVSPIVSPDAPSNHIRLDVHVTSSPQLNFQNTVAKLAGNVDLRLRGTMATPTLLGSVQITEGNALIAGTRYELQRGTVSFTNPVRIEPSIDLSATAHVSDYDIALGLHGTPSKLSVTYRSDPPLPEADVLALLALGRSGDQQRLYTQQQEQESSNPATDALLGGALNATVSSRVQKLFGAGSVKIDPNYIGALGNTTSRIIVEEQVGRAMTLTYATNVDTTQQQLLQAEIAINRHVSLLVARDESGVFSMVVKATRRFR